MNEYGNWSATCWRWRVVVWIFCIERFFTEEQRLKNIERNRQLLQQLDILRAKDDTFDIPSTTTLPKRRLVTTDY